MEKMSVHDKAIRLCEGGIVEIDGHCVCLMRCDDDENGCFICEMDSICRMEMVDVCAECSAIVRTGCYLKLANTRR